MASCDGEGEKLRVHSMSRGHRLRYAILDNRRSSASLGGPTIQCYGSSPYPAAHFLENCRWTNVETDIEILGVPQAGIKNGLEFQGRCRCLARGRRHGSKVVMDDRKIARVCRSPSRVRKEAILVTEYNSHRGIMVLAD